MHDQTYLYKSFYTFFPQHWILPYRLLHIALVTKQGFRHCFQSHYIWDILLGHWLASWIPSDVFLVSHVLHNSETQLDRGSMAGMCRIHCKPWNHWAHGSTQSQRGHLGQWSLREVDGSETHSCRVFPARAAGACLHLPRRGQASIPAHPACRVSPCIISRWWPHPSTPSVAPCGGGSPLLCLQPFFVSFFPLVDNRDLFCFQVHCCKVISDKLAYN